jgi:hypothetical protein
MVTLSLTFDPRQGQRIFPLASVSRPALGPSQPPVQWVPEVLSPGVKRGRAVTLTTHPHLVPRPWMIWSYTSCPSSRVSSGSIVSDYGLDDRAIGVRFPAGAKDFSCSLCVQTGSGAHPASWPMGTGDPFPGGKARPGRDADHLPPSSAEVENE